MVHSERSDRVSVSSEGVLSQYVCGLLSVSPHALCLTSLSVLSQSPLSPQTHLLLLFFFCCNRRANQAGGSLTVKASKEGPPAQHVKALSHTYTHIHGDPVSACLALHRVVISHQADQRTTAGSERALPRRSPSGWQAIAHPQLTGRHTLHLTAVSAPGLCLKCG